MTKPGLLILGLFSLASCTAPPAYTPCQQRVATAECYTDKKASAAPIDLVKQTFAATDALIKHSQISANNPPRFWVSSVADLNDLEYSSALGRLLGEQIAARLVQRGYDVREARLHKALTIIPHTGEFTLSRDHQLHYASQNAENAVTGTYSVADDRVFITLKMLNLAKSTVLASHAYSLPLERNVVALLAPKQHWWW